MKVVFGLAFGDIGLILKNRSSIEYLFVQMRGMKGDFKKLTERNLKFLRKEKRRIY